MPSHHRWWLNVPLLRSSVFVVLASSLFTGHSLSSTVCSLKPQIPSTVVWIAPESLYVYVVMLVSDSFLLLSFTLTKRSNKPRANLCLGLCMREPLHSSPQNVPPRQGWSSYLERSLATLCVTIRRSSGRQ